MLNTKTFLKLFLLTMVFGVGVFGVAENAYAERFFQGHSTFYERVPSNPVKSSDSDRIINKFKNGGIGNLTLSLAIPVYKADETSVLTNVILTDGKNGTTLDTYDYSYEVNNWGWGTVPLNATNIPQDSDCRCNGSVPKSYEGQYAACFNNNDQRMNVISKDGTQAWVFYHAYTCDGSTFYANSVRMFRNTEDGVGSHNTSDGFMGCSFDEEGNPVPTPAAINPEANRAGRPFDSYGGGGMMNTSKINGILTYAEVADNSIDHAIVYGGRSREDGTSWSHMYPSCPRSSIQASFDAIFVDHPKGGQRFYLKMTEAEIVAYANVRSWSNAHKAVMRAMRDYGVIFYELTGKTDNFMYLYADASTPQADWVELFGGTGGDANAYSFGTGLYQHMVAIDPLKPPFSNQTYQCSDTIDNDSDGLTDYPSDPGCSSATDNDETDIVYACSDTIDNDGDGKIDYGTGAGNDPGCSSSTDNDETDPILPQNSITTLKTLSPILINGNLTENAWSQANSVSFTNTTKSDNSVTVSTLWDTNNLYFAFSVTDANLKSDNSAVWQDDGVEVFLDTGHEKTASMDTNDYKFLASIGDVISGGNIQVKAVSNSNGYVIEMAVPWSTINTTPVSDKTMGLLLANDDVDVTATHSFDWLNLIATGSYARPNLWGDIIISGTTVDSSDTTAPAPPQNVSVE